MVLVSRHVSDVLGLVSGNRADVLCLVGADSGDRVLHHYFPGLNQLPHVRLLSLCHVRLRNGDRLVTEDKLLPTAVLLRVQDAAEQVRDVGGALAADDDVPVLLYDGQQAPVRRDHYRVDIRGNQLRAADGLGDNAAVPSLSL